MMGLSHSRAMNSSPLDLLLRYYAERGVGDQLWAHVEWCGEHGVAHFSPRVAVLALPTRHDWPVERVLGWERFDSELTLAPDTWHILFAAGELGAIAALAPYPLPYVSFQRNGGRLRVYRLEEIEHGIRKQTKGPGRPGP